MKTIKSCLFVCVGLLCGSVSTFGADLLRDVDPCTVAKRLFEEKLAEALLKLILLQNQTSSVPFDAVQYEAVWQKLATAGAVKQLAEHYQAAKLSTEQLDVMAAAEVAAYRQKTTPEEFQAMLERLFEEQKQQSLAQIDRQRGVLAAEAGQQREKLDKACGNGEVERVLRVALDFVGHRFESIKSESSLDAKVLKFATGVSLADIERYGLLGGPNSEARKLLSGIESTVTANLAAAQRESGDVAQGIRATTGISVGDIQKNGILGGENSDARKVIKALGF